MKPVVSLNNLSQFARRVIVVVMYAVAAAVVAYWASLVGGPSAQQLGSALRFSIIGSVVFHLCFLLLYLTTKRLSDPADNRAMDERELALRNRAYFFAYLIFGFGIGFLWFVPLPQILHDLGFLWKFLVFFSFYGSLPTAIIAWLEPNPIANEPEGGLRQ